MKKIRSSGDISWADGNASSSQELQLSFSSTEWDDAVANGMNNGLLKWITSKQDGGGGSGWVNAENTDIDTGTEVVDSFNPDGDGSVIWHYYITSNDGNNARSGTINAHWDDSAGGTCIKNEVMTTDRGDTTGVTLDVNMDGAAANVRLVATVTTDNWTVRVLRSPLI